MGAIPAKIIRLLENVSTMMTLFRDNQSCAEEVEELSDGSFYDSYPGLEAKNYVSESITLEGIEFDLNIDLDQIEEEEQWKLWPKIKHVQANFTFPISLSPEQFETKKKHDFRGLWTDAWLIIGGMGYDWSEMTGGIESS